MSQITNKETFCVNKCIIKIQSNGKFKKIDIKNRLLFQ